ncbi:uncharacterized protein LOC141506852 isoform X2 [Macrotis lagotis]|uniref:uncharacterized protein LOC141506852 isoform X2 n=1 Tax=Macrotis lagotis TaxID=92651 RepID=UPI003D69CD26
MVRSVTELILDEQNKKTAVQEKDMKNVLSAAAESSGVRHSAENVTVSSPTTVPPSQTVTKPWVVVGGPSKSKWQKSNDSSASSDDPCIICYEELNDEHSVDTSLGLDLSTLSIDSLEE